MRNTRHHGLAAGLALLAVGAAVTLAIAALVAPRASVEVVHPCRATTTKPLRSYCASAAQIAAHSQFLHLPTIPDSVMLTLENRELLSPRATSSISEQQAESAALAAAKGQYPTAKVRSATLAENVQIGATTGSLQWVVDVTPPGDVPVPGLNDAAPGAVVTNHNQSTAIPRSASHVPTLRYLIAYVSATTGKVDGLSADAW